MQAVARGTRVAASRWLQQESAAPRLLAKDCRLLCSPSLRTFFTVKWSASKDDFPYLDGVSVIVISWCAS